MSAPAQLRLFGEGQPPEMIDPAMIDKPKGLHVVRSAYFSPCGTWRYALSRWWRPAPVAVCCGLNPSTADAFKDDPTIASLSVQLDLMGFGCLLMLNAFAFKATKPKDMKAAEDPIGPDNDAVFARFLSGTKPGVFIAAWGLDGRYLNRDRDIMDMLACWDIEPMCFAVTMTGGPRHPLYLPHGATLIPYPGRPADVPKPEKPAKPIKRGKRPGR